MVGEGVEGALVVDVVGKLSNKMEVLFNSKVPNFSFSGNPPPNSSNNNNYTGGRQRQMKERHKNDFKQRGADKKRAKGMF